MAYTLNWLKNRLKYLDNYFGNTLSINSIITSNNFNIYPNPATNNIHINSIRELNDKNYKIFNGLGELFSNGTIENQKIKLKN